jgi:hypothetical protein
LIRLGVFAYKFRMIRPTVLGVLFSVCGRALERGAMRKGALAAGYRIGRTFERNERFGAHAR